MTNSMNEMYLRYRNFVRNQAGIGLMNLTYNLFRLAQLNIELKKWWNKCAPLPGKGQKKIKRASKMGKRKPDKKILNQIASKINWQKNVCQKIGLLEMSLIHFHLQVLNGTAWFRKVNSATPQNTITWAMQDGMTLESFLKDISAYRIIRVRFTLEI